MIVDITSIAVFPFLFLAWALNAYLFLVTVRLLFGCLARVRSNDLYLAIQTLSDPFPRLLDRKLGKWLEVDPPWLSWACVIVGVIILRQVMLGLAALVC